MPVAHRALSRCVEERVVLSMMKRWSSLTLQQLMNQRIEACQAFDEVVFR
jgi:hypothetical protein